MCNAFCVPNFTLKDQHHFFLDVAICFVDTGETAVPKGAPCLHYTDSVWQKLAHVCVCVCRCVMKPKSESFLSFLTGYSGYRIFGVGTGCGAIDTFRAGCGTVVSVTAWRLLSLVGIFKKQQQKLNSLLPVLLCL